MAPANLKVWRIEKLEMVPVPRAQYGYFYSGDSYLVMNEKKDSSGKVSYDLHMWIGKDSTQDEYGACALHCVRLDDEYGGVPVQHRETQMHESTLFIGYFKPAIKYLEGGVATGFKHAETNDYSDIKRLMWVRGRRQVRADIVPLQWSSFNTSDSFIVDVGKDIYVWSGPKANRFEGLQAVNVANAIRDDERGGRAKVRRVSASDVRQLEKFLGKYPGTIAEGEPEPERQSFANIRGGNNCKLFQVSDDSGEIAVTLMSDKAPFQQSLLDEGNVFILSNIDMAQIYVWKGKSASKNERKEAFKIANNFVEKEGLSKNTKITVMAQNAETALFKNLFTNWTDVDSQKGLGDVWSVNKIAKIAKVDFDSSTLHAKPDLAALYQLPDNGSGDVKVWRVEGSDKQPVDKGSYGQFYGGDCYIILYSYQPRGRQEYLLYYWIGSKATKDEVAALPILTIKTDEEECNGAATQIRVTQGKEPPHMLLIFGGQPLIVNLGGTSRQGGQTAPADTRLFHVKGGFNGHCRAVEVATEAGSLNSNDAFLLISSNGTFVWEGKGASDAERKACFEVSRLLKASTPKNIDEGSEPGQFWSALGGEGDYSKDPRMEDDVRPPRLFECSDASGNVRIEEVVGDWAQEDLVQDNVMMLDAWSAIYLWIGRNASAQEKEQSQEEAKEYLDTDPTERDQSTPIYKIQQGNEPLSFKGYFQGWDHDMWA